MAYLDEFENINYHVYLNKGKKNIFILNMIYVIFLSKSQTYFC